jgi:hypothetical protein
MPLLDLGYEVPDVGGRVCGRTGRVSGDEDADDHERAE